MKFTYLIIDFLSVAAPFLFSFHPKIKFYREFRAFFAANFISAFCFIIWDVVFTAKEIWGFNEKFILEIKVYNLPLEEILFFVCIPFACVFTYRCLNLILKKSWNGNNEKIFSTVCVIMFFALGIWFWKRTYTAATFISFSVLLFLIRFGFQQKWVGNLYRAWIVLLLPFFVVNGILTGTALSSPVVWYNNHEIIGVRILTIPVEDFVYGLELMMMVVFFYEMFLLRFRVATRGATPLIIQKT